jgi:Arc/MetJ-type ribon-helix-helix transcriptional regulator
MPRVGLYLTEPQVNKLRNISDKTGLTVSDLIRRALDDWLEKFEERERKKRTK